MVWLKQILPPFRKFGKTLKKTLYLINYKKNMYILILIIITYVCKHVTCIKMRMKFQQQKMMNNLDYRRSYVQCTYIMSRVIFCVFTYYK